MKKNIPLIIIISFILITFSACNESGEVLGSEVSEKTPTNILTTIAINEQYKANIEFAGEKSKDNYRNTGFFDLVVIDNSLKELDRVSINSYFGNKELTFYIDENGISVCDYNRDSDRDIAIGIPADDKNMEYKYVLFSVNSDGNIYQLPVMGYKDDGFLYTVNCGNINDFVSFHKSEDDKTVRIPVGIEENGIFVPAEYVYNGEVFVFNKYDEYIVSENIIPTSYYVSIVKTEYKEPKGKNDEGFSIYNSFINGRFDIVVRDSNGQEKGRLNINSLFHNNDITWAGKFSMVFEDYNNDGDYEMSFVQSCKDAPKFKFVLISIDENGSPYQLEIDGNEDGYIYDSSISNKGFKKLPEPLIGFSTSLHLGKTRYLYIWNDEKQKFIFQNH